jgi:hypothetical protein
VRRIYEEPFWFKPWRWHAMDFATRNVMRWLAGTYWKYEKFAATGLDSLPLFWLTNRHEGL